jgi:DNA-directed RNA polymerase subunit RPC12/RpoP
MTIIYAQSKMGNEGIEVTDDEITTALNKRLEEDAKKDKLNEEVEKRVKVINEDKEKKRKETEVREAKFTDTESGKKKTVGKKEDIECCYCDSKDLEKISDDDDTYVYQGKDISAVYKCNDCGRTSGVER